MKSELPDYRRVVFCLLIAVASPTDIWANEHWQAEFDDASILAKQQGKDILIAFSGTDWCRPCKLLWQQSFSQQQFIELACKRFVLLHVDDLAREAMPEGRKQRYEALQQRYGIHAYPTVVLTTMDGLPYAETGMLEKINGPLAYWKHLEPLYERGQKFNAVIRAAGGPKGFTSPEAVVDALAEVRPDFVVRFYSDKLAELRKLAPTDPTGYLAFIEARSELSAMEDKVHQSFLATYDKWAAGEPIEPRWVKEFSPRDVDLLIAKHRLRGATLQSALLVRAFLEVDSGRWSQVLTTLDEIGAIDAPPSRFEQSNFVQVSIKSPQELRRHIGAAHELAGDQLAQLRALYAILRQDLECVTPTSCCNHSFTLQLHWLVAGAAYGELLLTSTAHMQGEARAAAIGKGLENIELFANGSIGRLVREVMPNLVGKEAAKKHLPAGYAEWLEE